MLEALLAFGSVLVLAAALEYGHGFDALRNWSLGVVVLLVALAGLEGIRRHAVSTEIAADRSSAIDAGLALALLWTLEILINNVLAPPLPGRDVFDNAVWAIISLSILGVAALAAWRRSSIMSGIRAGAWAGLTSGLVACVTAFCVIVFGMSLLTSDPLNVAEWGAHRAASGAGDMASYFALQTLAGALGHLVLIGLAMGSALGALGGALGLGVARSYPVSERPN